MKPLYLDNDFCKLLVSNQKLGRPVFGITSIDLLSFKDDGTVFNDKEHMTRAYDILYRLYRRYLRKDPLWHLIYEGDSTVLRISDENVTKVMRFLKRMGVNYSSTGAWGKDSQFATAYYQVVFTYLFHGFSVLAMELPAREDAIWLVADRVFHIFVNPLVYKQAIMCQQSDVRFDTRWEGMLMARLGVARGYYQGMYDMSHNTPVVPKEKDASSD